jgi:DNA-binding ferritin-like protein
MAISEKLEKSLQSALRNPEAYQEIVNLLNKDESNKEVEQKLANLEKKNSELVSKLADLSSKLNSLKDFVKEIKNVK